MKDYSKQIKRLQEAEDTQDMFEFILDTLDEKKKLNFLDILAKEITAGSFSEQKGKILYSFYRKDKLNAKQDELPIFICPIFRTLKK